MSSTTTSASITTSDSARPIRVGQIAINVNDLQRAIAFYRDILGLTYLFEIPQAAFFRIGETRLMLGTAEDPEFDHPASTLYYQVDDLDAAHRALVEKGAKVEHEPHLIARMPDHDLWMSFFRDSENNLLGLMAEKPKT
jgi:methylmalonyl-CoA/ethylmalonyl-CoA epimerase